MWIFYLLPLQMAAIVCDLCERKIPNVLIVSGLITGAAYQWSTKGPPGLLDFAGGALVPLLLLGVLHYFRMLGAGDIKLLMMAGCFLGPKNSLKCVCLSFLAAGVLAAAAVVRHGLLRKRLHYLLEYIRGCCRGEKWTPYIVPGENSAYLYFSIPVLAASLAVIGGIF